MSYFRTNSNDSHSENNNPNIAQTSHNYLSQENNSSNTSNKDDKSSPSSLIDRPKSSPSTLNNISSTRPPLTTSASYASTSSASTARPSLTNSRPKTSYYALTWKENLDAFNKRLRRGSLSFDAITQDEDQQQPSLPTHINQRKESFGQSSIQDEHAPLLDNSDQSKLSYTATERPGNNDWTLDTSAPNSAGLNSSGHGSAGNSNRFNQDQDVRKPAPAFPTQLNPALATTQSSKLGVISGVFVPCVLSIWGIILFLRFGFIISQAGVIGTLGMFIVGYAVNVFTSLSLSAISTNGTVRGGGVYYLLSRSLGPEFGGSIGLIYFLCTVVGCGMNVLGFVEPLISNFGETSGTVYRVLPEGWGWGFLYGTTLLISCTLICLVGSKLFARSSLVLAVIILLSTLSIFISFALMPPFTHPERNIEYTGFSWTTLQENLWPRFTSTTGPEGPKQSFQTVFGVLFPACIGILAGASMSGDLEDPSKSIPKGTLWAVGSTFCVYTLIVILMGGSISRSTMYSDLSVLQDVSVQPLFIAAGSLAASVFAVLGSVIGAAKILQAIARDNLLPLLAVFSQGTPFNDEPTLAVLFTYILCQLCLFLTDMNAIATFVSLITLLTFLILNLACFLLKIGSAPNFRPSFRFFHWWTAFGGMVLCAIVMGFVDLGQSLLSGLMTAVLFIWIHYWSPPKRWGDVTQSLIYHQVRKYLLRLDSRKEHVKFWRPQILLLVHHPRSEYQLIQFCNHLKKGALYVLGHVILGDLRDVLVEYRRQQGSWLKFVDVTQIKAFVNLSIADSVRIGARNLLIGSGLGGMRPNIVVLGSFNLQKYLKEKGGQGQEQTPQQASSPQTHLHPLKSAFVPPSIESDHQDHTLLNIPVSLPIDNIRVEAPINITDYVAIIEDVLALNKAVAIGYGFDRLELPEEHRSSWKSLVHSVLPSSILPQSTSRPSSLHKLSESKGKKYIDLWPMQMSITPQHFEQSFPGNKRASKDFGPGSPMISGHGIFPESYGSTGAYNSNSRILDGNLTNFDTYAMVLQMGCILHMVPQWKDNYILRVMVFVEYEADVEEETKRLYDLLENLRIPAEVKVISLDGGDSETYARLVKGEGSDPRSPSFVQNTPWVAEPEEFINDPEEDGNTAPIAPVAQRSGPRNINPHWKEHALLEEDEEGEEGTHQSNIQEDEQSSSSYERGLYPNQLESSRDNSPSPSRNLTGRTANMSNIGGYQGNTLPHRRRTISHPTNPQQPQRTQSPGNLRVNTGFSPRPRQGSPLGASFVSPTTAGTNIPRYRNTLAGSLSPMEPRLGTSVPLGASTNFRISVPLPRQYFDPNGLNSSESESDSISSEDDAEYDRNDDDLTYNGLYLPQNSQDQQQKQRLAYLLSPITRFPNKQIASMQESDLTTQPSLSSQQPPQQAHIGQQRIKSPAFAHTSIGSERGLGIALGDSSVKLEQQQHPFSPSASTKRLWVTSAGSSNSPVLGSGDINNHQNTLDISQETHSIPSNSPETGFRVNSYNDWTHNPETLHTPSNFTLLQDGNFGPSPQVPLQFDHLGPESQLIIMNELMRIHSSSETTSIVFTTVPAPELGTCLHEQSSVAYLEKIDLLMDRIDVPVLLLHAKSLTVTMTL